MPWWRACQGLLRWMLGISLRGERDIPPGPLLVVANRVSVLDTLALALVLPGRPWLAPSAPNTGGWPLRHLPFEPNPAAQRRLLSRYMEEGRRLVMFPEAFPSPDGWPGPVSPLAALAALESDTPLLPVWIERIGRWGWPWLRLTLLPTRRLAPLAATEAPPTEQARQRLEALMRELAWAGMPVVLTLDTALRHAARRHGWGRGILEHPRLGMLDYRRLFREVERWRRRLATRGERQVGILLGEGSDSLILMLALQGLGRVPVLLDPRLDAQSLLACCQTVKLGLVYTRREQRQPSRLIQQLSLLGSQPRVLFLEDLESADAPPAPTGPVGPHGPALVIFSRPAGEPFRALRFSHRNLLDGVARLRAMLTPTTADTVLCLLPNTHPLGLLAGRLLPILHGARSAAAEPGLSTEQLPGTVHRVGATVLVTTGNALEPCYRVASARQLASLRQVWIPAGTLGREARQRWAERVGCRPVEFHVPATFGAVVAVDLPQSYRPPGESSPLPGLDYRLEATDRQARGELLWVRAGHLADALATADRPGQWRTAAAPGWWCSGDLLLISAEGSWRFRGRFTRHTRVGNECVSLASLEQLLYHHWPGERHLVLELENDGQTGLTVLTTCQQLSHTALGALLQAEGFSERWLPDRVIVVGDWPLAASGQSNQLALRQLAQTLIGVGSRTLH